jgi:ribosomal protein S8
LVKRISISLDPEQVDLLHAVKGLGSKEAEKVKNIVLAYLSEKGYLQDFNKKEGA